MEHTLTPKAQAKIDELAANGVMLQDLAPIVGLAAEFASAAGTAVIDIEHIEQAMRVQEIGEAH